MKTVTLTGTNSTSGRTATAIVTPLVVREARSQFNCSTAVGLVLEEEGGSSSASSHWEYTVMQVGQGLVT